MTASLDPTVSVASPLDPRKSSSLLYRALQLFLFLHKAAISHRLGTRGSPRLSSGIHEQKNFIEKISETNVNNNRSRSVRGYCLGTIRVSNHSTSRSEVICFVTTSTTIFSASSLVADSSYPLCVSKSVSRISECVCCRLRSRDYR